MKYLFFSLSLILSSCATQHKATVNINPVFQPYYDKFIADAKASHHLQVDDLIIEFGDLGKFASSGEGVNGRCHMASNETPTVTINDNPSAHNWYTSSEDFREALIYHELGHCLLSLIHDQSQWVTPDGAEVDNSIMNSDLPQDWYHYDKYHDHYINQLFMSEPSSVTEMDVE